MNLFNHIVEEYGVPEEDQKELKNQLQKWRDESEEYLYQKNPPYLMQPYMKQIEKDTNRYMNLGNVSR